MAIPKTFQEYHEQNPDGLYLLARKLLGYDAQEDDVLDLEQEFALHLMTLHEDSVYREKGAVDRVGTFDGEKYGANLNEKLFYAYIKRILTNFYYTRYKGSKQDAMGNQPVQLVTKCHEDADEGSEISLETIASPDFKLDEKILWSEVYSMLPEELRPLFDCVAEGLTGAETEERLGITRSQYVWGMKKLRDYCKRHRSVLR